jgi:hypothetical protein
MNWTKELDHAYDVSSQATFSITREKWELKNAKATRKAKLEILNNINKEYEEKLKNAKLSNG